MKVIKMSMISSLILSGTLAYATDAATPKRTLKPNNMEVYNILPGSADTLAEMFSKGEFYGRIRFNSFKWNWGTESSSNQNNWATAIGSSLIYKSAYLGGFGFTSGVYTSYNPWHMDSEDVKYAKAGKDLFSRYKVSEGNGFEMVSLAQAYLEYKNQMLSIKVGRQLFESYLTASNDTKMIPNAFEGITLRTTYVPDTEIKAAYLTRQKLRDHEGFHHLLAFGDDPDDPYAKWDENDDAAMHKGLTLSKLEAAGIDDRLIVFQATNNTLKALTVMFNYTAVTDLVSSATIDAKYALKLDNGLSISPAIRYMRQMDDGAGAIGGANLKANTVGYDDPNSLDGGLIAAKVDIIKGAWSVGVGYSKVFDEGDLIAPWRGFPTGGYTRLMGQYNWYANTQTTAIYGTYDFDKAGLVSGLQAKVGYAIQNFDDAKPGVQADSNAFTVDFIKKFASMPNLYTKVRLGVIRGDDDTVTTGGEIKSDPSYTDLRFEVNYLF